MADGSIGAGRLQRLVARADAIAREVGGLEERLAVLEGRYEQLRMVALALWELVKDTTELTEEELIGRLAELECEAGKRAGKYTREASVCPACSRPVPQGKTACIYCGEPMTRTRAFHGT